MYVLPTKSKVTQSKVLNMIKEAQLIRIREEDKSRKLLDDGMANPNEQWWWKDATRLLNATWASSPKSVEILQGIVAEAERRGRVAAWEDMSLTLTNMREHLEADSPWITKQDFESYEDAINVMQKKIDAKLSALSNSQEKV